MLPPIRAVLQLATVGAVLRETARLPQAAAVMSPAITSAPAVMTSSRLAATVRTHWQKNVNFKYLVKTVPEHLIQFSNSHLVH